VFRVTACLALTISLVLSAATAQDFSRAESLYQHTDYEGSLALLDKNSGDSAVNFLIGRDYFMMGEFKKACEYIQKASAAAPTNSEYMDWLGRAYGRRAETANPLSAPSHASKARQAFEQAVKLDSKNSDALSDLFDYYVDAPGFLGGGLDKAEQVAQKIAAIDPPQGYYVRAQLAQKRKDFENAEQSLRKAVAIAPHEVGHMVTLARFLANQGRTRESDAVFAQAEKINPNAPQVWFARADTLIKEKRNLQEARELLQRYVKAPTTVDDPPKTEAARLLRQF
jgi:tetratricopeptide (TPR) repeat protein